MLIFSNLQFLSVAAITGFDNTTTSKSIIRLHRAEVPSPWKGRIYLGEDERASAFPRFARIPLREVDA